MIIIVITSKIIIVIWKSMFSWWDKIKIIKVICWLHKYVDTYIQNQLDSLLICWDIRFWQILQYDWSNPFWSIIQKQNWRVCNGNYKIFYLKLLMNWFLFAQVYFFSKNWASLVFEDYIFLATHTQKSREIYCIGFARSC